MILINDILKLLEDVPRSKLDQLLEAYGVAPGFIEYSGNFAVTPLNNRLNILEKMGICPRTEKEVDQLIRLKQSAGWVDWVKPVIVMNHRHNTLNLYSRLDESTKVIDWFITTEEGEEFEGKIQLSGFETNDERWIDDICYVARTIWLVDLPVGYHWLRLENEMRTVKSFIIVTPDRCYEPEWLKAEERIWGLSVQLYSVRSEQNYGIGDFIDLAKLIDKSFEQGADFLLLNPLHALDNHHPENASPYSPIDRRFLNPLYIAPTMEDDFRYSLDIQQLFLEPGFQSKLDNLRAIPFINYSKVFEIKYKIFDLMFKAFSSQQIKTGSARAKEFEQYVNNTDRVAFANCQSALIIPNIDSSEDPNFHLYLQWIADKQLVFCQNRSIELGMKVGVIRDLAVGGGDSNFEIITHPDLFCTQARIGAPPDSFNPDGQNWGLIPLYPEQLKNSLFAHFIGLLRENMKACGAIRIDHVMALMRLWWCASDGSSASGAYVHYPVDELFAILRIESNKADCIVIGEDLGIVPPEIRSHINDSGVLSNVIFYFEKYDGWHFKKPKDYPRRALAIVANHDVPPLKAWWNFEDLKLRKKLHLINSEEELSTELEHRVHEKLQVLAWLDAEGKLPDDWRDTDTSKIFDLSLCQAIFKACASSNSLLVSIQLDDVAELETPINIPGTDKEYPNWRRKIPINLDALFENKDTHQLLSMIREERP